MNFALAFGFMDYQVLIFVLSHLDLYVLRDDASIFFVSFKRTKHLCVLIHIRIKEEAGTVKDV